VVREWAMSDVTAAVDGTTALGASVLQGTPWPIEVTNHLVILRQTVLAAALVILTQYFIEGCQHWVRHHDSTTVMASAASS
jgi:hypothetical protein